MAVTHRHEQELKRKCENAALKTKDPMELQWDQCSLA